MTDKVVEIKPLNIQVVEIPLIGETELITHRWSDKAKKMMLDKQMGKASPRGRGTRETKDPEADYLSSMYQFDDGRYGFPSVGFKAAIVGACRLFDGLPMTVAKVAIRVEGETNKYSEQLTHIIAEPHIREDMVRLESGVADIRYRAGFWPWSATIRVKFNAGVISLEQLYNLVDAAGFGGIGEWRPSAPKSATGSYGCFAIVKGLGG